MIQFFEEMPTRKPRVQVVLSDSVYERLKVEADRDRRTLSSLAAIAIEEWLDNRQGEGTTAKDEQS